MNEQIAAALGQLRDIHEPAVPGFWPLPIGWWVLAVCIVIGIAALVIWLRRRHLQFKPYRELRKTATELQDRYNTNQLSPLEYVSLTNRLFKYLMVKIEGVPGAAQADGSVWLRMLAQRFQNVAFVHGAGVSLGRVRYAPDPFIHEDLNLLVESTLCKVKPIKRSVRTP